MKKYFAIAPLNEKEVWLLCERLRIHKNETVTFFVINGAWEGTLMHDGAIKLKQGEYLDQKGKVVWQGDNLPCDEKAGYGWDYYDYQDNIDIINKSL